MRELVVRHRFTGRAQGDLRVSLPAVELAPRRHRVATAPWTWLEQVHGAEVVVARSPGDRAGARADAVVTDVPGAVLAVHTADCAPVLLSGATETGVVIGAAHAGWRGLRDGVLDATVRTMRSLGAMSVTWRLGPCISPQAYEFGADDLEALVERFGPSVRATTAEGAPALDLRAGVRVALDAAGATESLPNSPVPCTVLEDGWFSWRRDRTSARQAAAIWIEPGAVAGPGV